MPECSLKYIPKRLLWEKQPIISQFMVGDELYRRCKSEELENPFKTISLTELSHNYGGKSSNSTTPSGCLPKIIFSINSNLNTPLSFPDDVLYSIREDEPFEKYADKEVCILEIKNLTPEKSYDKTFEQKKGEQIKVGRISLIHEPVPCMYPHFVFRIWLDGQIVTYQNYKTTLKTVNKIRTSLKHELASMIRTRSIKQN